LNKRFLKKRGNPLAKLLRNVKHLSRPMLHLLLLIFGARGAYVAAKQARRSLSKKPRILLVHPGHLGSLVMTTPLFHALRTQVPDVYIAVMVGPWSREVFVDQSSVDQVIVYPFPSMRDGTLGPKSYFSLRNAAKELRRGNYDLAINLRPNFWWGAALLYLARIPRRVGPADKECEPLLTEALPLSTHEHLTASYLCLLSAGLGVMGYPALEEPYTEDHYPLHFEPTAQDCQWIAECLRKEGVETSTSLVVIHPGTGGAVKLWRPEGWAICANALAQSVKDRLSLHIVLTGSKSEQPLLEEIAGSVSFPITIMTNMTLGQLAALLRRAQCVLGVDSGPLHLAAAQGTPTVQIFGPTDPAIFGLWAKKEQHTVVASRYRCPTCPLIPCMGLDLLPKDPASHPCVRLVPEQEVLTAISRQFPHLQLNQENTLVGGVMENLSI
jgi:ADP-heptose:LPS heptosyltransferase